jgi:folate/biopterin transporter
MSGKHSATSTTASSLSSRSEPNDAEDDEEAVLETAPLVVGSKQQDGSLSLTAAGKAASAPVVSDGKDSSVLASLTPETAVKWLRGLQQQFGNKLLVLLVVSQHLMKGFASSLTGPATQYLYASYKVLGPRMQVYGGVTALPWAMKPVIGLVSDCFPIGGLNKGPYIVFSSVLGVIALSFLGAANQGVLSIEKVVACLFLVSLQFSTCDLLTEAKYAEKMQEKPEHGPDLMTFVWFGLQVGGLVATLMVGPLMAHFGPKAPYLLALLPAALIILPASKNYLEETPKTAEQVQESRAKLFEQKEACFLCLLMFAGTVVLTTVGIAYESVALNALVAVVVALVMLTAFSLVLRPVVAKVNAFFLVQTSLGFSVGGASFYFFTDGPAQYPEGPHFSMIFFTSVLGLVGAVCSLIGIFSYQRFMKNWTYRGLLMMTNIVLSLLNVSDVIVLSRLNVKLGIPDTVFVLGASVLQTIVGQWMWMPGVVILSQLCPKGMEATMYALLAGCHNLGNTIASNCGAYVLLLLNCNPSGAVAEGHQFENLWKGSALSTVLPMFTLFLLPWLIPDAKQTDKLLNDEDRDATSGSLWRQLTGT